MGMQRILSIEIGYASIRILDMDRGTNPKIYNLIEIETPKLAVSDGYLVPEKLDEISKAITAALKKNMIRTKKAVFTIFSSKIFTREVALPVMKDKQLHAVIEENITDYFPIELEDYAVTYTVIDTMIASDQTFKNKLLLIAAEKKLILQYEKLADMCRLTLIDVDYVGNSVYQLFKNIPRTSPQMFVKVEPESTLIMILDGNRMTLQRNLNYGTGLGELDETEIIGNLRPIIGTLSRVMHFYSGQSMVNIDKVILIGQGSEYVDLFNQVSANGDVLYETLEKFDNIRILKENENVKISDFTAGIGAAVAPINLINYKAAYKRVNYIRASILMGIFYLVVIATLGLSVYIPYFDAKTINEALLKEEEKYQEAIEIHDTYVIFEDFYESFTEGKEMTSHPNDGLISFLEELEKKMPSDAVVESFNSNDETVILQVSVENKEEAAGVIDMFRDFDTLMSVSVTSVDGDESDEDGKVVFVITGTYYPTAPSLDETSETEETEEVEQNE